MEAAAKLVPRCGKTRPRIRGKKGAIIRCYHEPPAETRVICVDEMGPIAVKTYPGEAWQQGSNRATFEPDYGRRGMVWVHGAFEPATGQAAIVLSPKRDSVSHIQLLEKVITEFPSQRWMIIEDNLSTHSSRETQLALTAWPEIQVQFTPKYACWLNLIEPWWKQLRSLALKGRCFTDMNELTEALNHALSYWNGHCHPYIWKKRPQEQAFLEPIGGFGVYRPTDNLAI
ncbi:MAG: IS630 family transposase [Ardenticatenaceae bacterium]|nr:IS630 family transposase [Ardenticatenaceae bacterium]MCB9432413.1 IS630 family transposase [Ardenticatenaceae bacterium]